MCWAAQWGPVEYHEQSLRNLAVAMQRTKRLCAIIVDTIGREIMINRPFSLDEACCAVDARIQGLKLRHTLPCPWVLTAEQCNCFAVFAADGRLACAQGLPPGHVC